MDLPDTISAFCSIGGLAGDWLSDKGDHRSQRDCFCDDRENQFCGYDENVTDWIREAVKIRMASEGWVDPEDCPHDGEWREQTGIMRTVYTTYRTTDDGGFESLNCPALECAACGKTKPNMEAVG